MRNTRAYTAVTGDWHPVFKAMRDRMLANGITWVDLSKSSGIATTCLRDYFMGNHIPPFTTVECIANALCYHCGIKPMSEAEITMFQEGNLQKVSVLP